MGDTHRQGEVEQAGIEITLIRRGPKLSKENRWRRLHNIAILAPTLEAIKPSTSRLDLSLGRISSGRWACEGLRGLCLEPIRCARRVVSVGLASSTLLLVRWAPLLVERPCNLDLIRLTIA
jgi:hypothetical protein